MPKQTIPEHVESAKRLLNGPLNPFDVIPYSIDPWAEIEKIDEPTRIDLVSRLTALPEELSSPNYLDEGARQSEKWILSTHHGNDGTLITQLQTWHGRQDEFRRTTIHLRPDSTLGVFAHHGYNTEASPVSQPLAETLLSILPEVPYEGKPADFQGEKGVFQKVPTGAARRSQELQKDEEIFFTLKSWFAHHSPGVPGGPGWDSRHILRSLSPQEMLHRYGHVFTNDEISQPGGIEDFQTGELSGGMPDDIPYYAIIPDR